MDFKSEVSSVGVENSVVKSFSMYLVSSWKTRTNTLHITVKIIRQRARKISGAVRGMVDY